MNDYKYHECDENLENKIGGNLVENIIEAEHKNDNSHDDSDVDCLSCNSSVRLK